MCKKTDIVDILKSDINRIHRSIPYDSMYDETAKKIMELFEDDKEKLQTKVWWVIQTHKERWADSN